MLRLFVPLIAAVLFVLASFMIDTRIVPEQDYPIWIKDIDGSYMVQTSGLFLIDKAGNEKTFISCDDVGLLYLMKVNENNFPPTITLDSIKFSSAAAEYFREFYKKDFEEVCYDKESNTVYISMEGNNEKNDAKSFRKYEGIFGLEMNETLDTINYVRRLNLPAELFKYTDNNVAFEGMALSDKYMFLGLENKSLGNGIFSDHSLIYILDRTDFTIIDTISTKDMDILTVCGLYAESDNILWGIDRNLRKLFRIEFDENMAVKDYETKKLKLSVPEHPEIDYMEGIVPESVYYDDGKVYVTIDPIKELYKPNVSDNVRLKSEEKENFKKKVSILLKYDVKDWK